MKKEDREAIDWAKEQKRKQELGKWIFKIGLIAIVSYFIAAFICGGWALLYNYEEPFAFALMLPLSLLLMGLCAVMFGVDVW